MPTSNSNIPSMKSTAFWGELKILQWATKFCTFYLSLSLSLKHSLSLSLWISLSLSLFLYLSLSLSLSESLSLSLSLFLNLSLSLSLSVWNILSLSLSLSIYSDSEEAPVMSPLLGNVCFASSQFGFAFTLYSFSLIYSESFGGFSAHDFSKRLWGDIFFNKTTSVLFLSTLLYSHNYAPIQTNFTDQLFVFSYLA